MKMLEIYCKNSYNKIITALLLYKLNKTLSKKLLKKKNYLIFNRNKQIFNLMISNSK